ncbi:unnamed protein product [Phytophthora lilii]|uniref:Unnamed protein product n=1 Tax=Phytophthora lilii TaxID=2077276 RepID=A0A9W7CHU4_9STRA|nr:unnamed protein product [Phytophthora lilii]
MITSPSPSTCRPSWVPADDVTESVCKRAAYTTTISTIPQVHPIPATESGTTAEVHPAQVQLPSEMDEEDLPQPMVVTVIKDVAQVLEVSTSELKRQRHPTRHLRLWLRDIVKRHSKQHLEL